MSDLSQLVQPPPTRPLHGRVQFWADKASGVGGRVEVEFERRRDGLSFRPASFLVYVVGADGVRLSCDREPWDEDVNDDLVTIGATAETPANEAERTGYALKFKLERDEVRYGDGYFNSVLVLLLRQLGFEEVPSVKRCLDRIAVGTPSTSSSTFSDCMRDIRATLAGVGSRLTVDLEYTNDDAEGILADAVAYYLDERFHVTNRERMGFQ